MTVWELEFHWQPGKCPAILDILSNYSSSQSIASLSVVTDSPDLAKGASFDVTDYCQ